jgi:hypothetical protein
MIFECKSKIQEEEKVKEILQRPGGPGYLEQQHAKLKLTADLPLHHLCIIVTIPVD